MARIITLKVQSLQTAFIVEHDFIMAAYLADRVVVYDGVPSSEATAHCPQSLLTGDPDGLLSCTRQPQRLGRHLLYHAVVLCAVTSDVIWHTALRLLSARAPCCMSWRDVGNIRLFMWFFCTLRQPSPVSTTMIQMQDATVPMLQA